MDFASANMDFEPRKVGVLFSILFVSLLAVSFPTISKLLPFLRIPTVVFFIGKHFGTGVILATAFIHLLDDAFRSLQSTKVAKTYPGLGKWTGAIILASLLSIFLIEYISTSYVEQLQDKPSAPPTPAASAHPSRSQSPTAKILATESTPLLPTAVHPVRRHSTDNHLYHHPHLPAGVPVEVLHNSPRICRLVIAHDHVNGGHHHHHHEHHLHEEYGLDADFQEPHQQHSHRRIGRRREIIGILVLQLGIMIHSLVIGMTLAITSGSDFTSLTTAVIFHQLFEGLSLGIRIAALPNASREREMNDTEGALDARVAVAVEEALRESADDVEAGSSTSSVERGKRLPWYNLHARLKEVHWFKPTLSFLFGVTTPTGMGLGMLLWPRNTPTSDGARMLVVQGVMSAISAGMLIYAATVEMLAADFVFGDVEGGTHHHHHHGDDDHHQEHEHSPEPDHEHGSHHRKRRSDASQESRASMCPPPTAPCWVEPTSTHAVKQKKAVLTEAPRNAVEEQSSGSKKATMGKRVLAVLSLLAGVSMMVAVGLGE